MANFRRDIENFTIIYNDLISLIKLTSFLLCFFSSARTELLELGKKYIDVSIINVIFMFISDSRLDRILYINDCLLL